MCSTVQCSCSGASPTPEGGVDSLLEERAKYTEAEKTNAAYCALQISVSEPNRLTMLRNSDILLGVLLATARTLVVLYTYSSPRDYIIYTSTLLFYCTFVFSTVQYCTRLHL